MSTETATTETDFDVIRRAASTIRERGAAATPFALAVAKWLEAVTASWPWDGDMPVTDPDGWDLALDESMDSYAVDVARAYLGESA